MGTRIFVGNLPYTTTSDDLEQIFSEFGVCESARIITDHGTGRSCGFGFVDMADIEAAREAIQGLDGLQFGGRALRVNHAHNQSRGDGGGGRPKQTGSRAVPKLQPRCPKCNLATLHTEQRGFSLGRAAAGGVIAGPVGLLGGLVGRKRPEFVCSACGWHGSTWVTWTRSAQMIAAHVEAATADSDAHVSDRERKPVVGEPSEQGNEGSLLFLFVAVIMIAILVVTCSK